MKSRKAVHGWRGARVLAAGVVVMAAGGCQTVRDLVALPFDVAGKMAADTARMPYEAAKMGAQGIVDALANAVR